MPSPIAVLIPAYEPGTSLSDLVRDLRCAIPLAAIVVVDDGSGGGYAGQFDLARALGADVLTHPVNWGKGRALKTGMTHILIKYPNHDVVCADSDGQHRPDDILRVAERLGEGEAAMVLGARSFSGSVPVRSRVGNAVTRRLFGLATGRDLIDTQTGLRGYPTAMIPALLSVPGERFEYEINLLLAASEHPQQSWLIEEVPITTVYLERNASSHFRPVQDSARVYLPLVKYAASGLAAFAIDVIGVLLIAALTGNLLAAAVGARLISSTFNFATNRRLVFDRSGSTSIAASAMRYAGLAVTILAANYVILWLLNAWLSVPLLPAKLLTEALLVGLSFALQRRFVFAKQAGACDAPADASQQPGYSASGSSPAVGSGK